MYNIQSFLGLLEEFAPLSLSYKFVERGGYDNSGIIVKTHREVKKVLFSLDLTALAVKRAKRLGCDTIVTHHPAIYTPLKALDIEDTLSGAVCEAVKNNLNVISMHLNLDFALGGIDESLCEGLGGKGAKVLDIIDGACGYGRAFDIEKTTLKGFVASIKKTFNTNKVVYYGNGNSPIKKVASFCGAGASDVEKFLQEKDFSAEVIVTSDVPHHVIKEIIEKGVNLVILTHYASENYGFKRFFERVKERIGLPAVYLEDKRFL